MAPAAETRQVRVGEDLVTVRIQEAGTPAVVFINSCNGRYGQWTDDGDGILPGIVTSLGKTTVQFDRRGPAESSPAAQPLDLAAAAEEAHATVAAAGVGAPYIVVGFSLGGLIARAWARLYPGDFAGYVDVDGSTELMSTKMRVAETVGFWRERITQGLASQGAAAQAEFRLLLESTCFETFSAAQGGVMTLPACPVAMIVCRNFASHLHESQCPGKTAETDSDWADAWVASHRELIARMPPSGVVARYVERSDLSHWDDRTCVDGVLNSPHGQALVLECIKEVVSLVDGTEWMRSTLNVDYSSGTCDPLSMATNPSEQHLQH